MMSFGRASTGLPLGPWWTNASFGGLLRSPDPAGYYDFIEG